MLEDKLNGISCRIRDTLKRAAVYSISAIMGLAELYAGIKSAEAKPEERQEAVFYDGEKGNYGAWHNLVGENEEDLSVDSCFHQCKSYNGTPNVYYGTPDDYDGLPDPGSGTTSTVYGPIEIDPPRF